MASDDPDIGLAGEHVPESEPLSLRVVRLMSIAADREETNLEPLARILDTDAVDALFSTARSRNDEHSADVRFLYEGYRVEIDADGEVRLLDDLEQQD